VLSRLLTVRARVGLDVRADDRLGRGQRDAAQAAVEREPGAVRGRAAHRALDELVVLHHQDVRRRRARQRAHALHELLKLSLDRSVHVTALIDQLDVRLSGSRERGAPWDGAAHPLCARPSTRRRREDRAEGLAPGK
jgi:hypothetical protein